MNWVKIQQEHTTTSDPRNSTRIRNAILSSAFLTKFNKIQLFCTSCKIFISLEEQLQIYQKPTGLLTLILVRSHITCNKIHFIPRLWHRYNLVCYQHSTLPGMHIHYRYIRPFPASAERLRDFLITFLDVVPPAYSIASDAVHYTLRKRRCVL